MNDYPKALEIYEESSPPNHANLMTCYNSIGFLYQTTDKYPKAGSFYEKALAIQQKLIPTIGLIGCTIKWAAERKHLRFINVYWK